MNPALLDSALPGFVRSCTELHQLLLPAGLALLVLAFAVEFWHGPPHPVELLKFLVKVFLIVLLMARSFDWINQGQTLVQNLIEQHVPANPEKVADRFKAKLAAAQNTPEQEDKSFLDSLFSTNWFEAIIFAILTLVSWLAMAVLFFIYTVQRACLLLCWCLGVLLYPTLAIRPLSHLGMKHLLRTIAILMWPLALALASTLTDGLLDVATDKSFLGDSGAVGALGRGVISLLCVLVIAVWIAFSTVAGPFFLQRLIAGSTGPAVALSKSADLITNVALPSAFGLPAVARRAGQAGRVILEHARQAWGQKPVDRFPGGAGESRSTAQVQAALPPATPANPAPEWRPGPDDPTGDKQARAFAKRTQRS